MLKQTDGRQSSILALIAQSESLTEEDKDRLLLNLTDDSLKIGKYMLGRTKRTSKEIKAAAQGLRDWAKQLKQIE
jgi:hypothetical protein